MDISPKKLWGSSSPAVSTPKPRPLPVPPAAQIPRRPLPQPPIKAKSTLEIPIPQRPAPEIPAPPKPASLEPASPESTTPEPATPESTTPEPATPEPATPEPATPEPASPEPASPELASPESAPQEPASSGSASQEPASEESHADKLMTEILAKVEKDWPQLMGDKCVPVQLALQLMDTSSLGLAHRHDEFREIQRELQSALKAVVNEHHQGFNSSIGTYHQIQASIQASQTKVRQLRENMVQAKAALSSTRPELRGLAAQSQEYGEMIKVIEQIEQLRLVPDKLEARISEKTFLTAVDLLQDALKKIRKPQMEAIGALSDLRAYLTNQETSLTDILIEELHSHLYLKSPYCQDRWKAHVKEISSGASTESTSFASPAVQPLYQFLEEVDFEKPLVEDVARNPEADSFYYIQLLVESISKMGKLDAAVEAIEQRLPVELFRVVEKTNNEVDQRHPSSLRAPTRTTKGKIDLGINDDDVRAMVVSDLLWTLYAKFEAIAEGHRVFHDVVIGVTKRDHIESSRNLTGSFRELWMLYQNEIRSLLHDYLATDSNIFRMSQSIKPTSDVYKRGQRNKNKKIFSLADTDPKSEHMLAEYADLEAILKASVPGLVSDIRRPVGAAGADDKNTHTDGAATGHKLLIEPSVFNMGSLLPPSLTFLQRLKDIVPPGRDMKISTLTSFLDDFLINVFLPQLDETLVKYSNQIFEESDAFQEDPRWKEISQRPIFKGASAFLNLIVAFCRMLDTIPHDQAFTQLIIGQMMSYYDRCCDWFVALVSRTQSENADDPAYKASAAVATKPGDVHDIIAELYAAQDPEQKAQLTQEEIRHFIKQCNDHPLDISDLISDRKTIASLCLLFTSMRWLAGKVNQLRSITVHDTDSTRRTAMRQGHNRRWTFLNNPNTPTDAQGSVYLPMTEDTVKSFDGIVNSCRELAGTVLLTLHMEPRTLIALDLAQCLAPKLAPYIMDRQIHEPDSIILSLNADLIAYDEVVSTYLRDSELAFIRNGLAQLVDSFLIKNAAHVDGMNKNGCDRMMLNILVLQQNLKNIEPSTNLSRSEDYFELFLEGGEAILKRAEEGKAGLRAKRSNGKERAEFDFEELKCLIELCWSEGCKDVERGVSTLAKRNRGSMVEKLMGVIGEGGKGEE